MRRNPPSKKKCLCDSAFFGGQHQAGLLLLLYLLLCSSRIQLAVVVAADDDKTVTDQTTVGREEETLAPPPPKTTKANTNNNGDEESSTTIDESNTTTAQHQQHKKEEEEEQGKKQQEKTDEEHHHPQPLSSSTKASLSRFVSKTIIIPHDDKKFYGGQDAAWNTDELLVVVDASGVWTGLDPGGYARKLAVTIAEVHSDLLAKDNERDTTAAASPYLGSIAYRSSLLATDALWTWDWGHLDTVGYTLVGLSRDAPGAIETVQRGDSGFSVHRRISPTDPDGDLGPVGLLCASYIPGSACHVPPGTVLRHNPKDKDIVVVVSNGVIDNWDPRGDFQNMCIGGMVWSADMEGFDEKELLDARYGGSEGYFEDGEIVSLSAVADCIARQAHFFSREKRNFNRFADRTYRGTREKQPWQDDDDGYTFYDGTPDDITVTVAQIRQQPTNNNNKCDNNNTGGGDGEVFAAAKKDFYRTEPVFVYQESDGPIDRQTIHPPSMAKVLQDILDMPEEFWNERRKQRREQRRKEEMESEP